MPNVHIGLNVPRTQPFQFRVEFGHAVLREQEEQVESQNLVHVGRLW